MFRNWTFGQRIAGGFALLVVLTVLIGIIAAVTLQTVIASKDRVITVDSRCCCRRHRCKPYASS